MKKLTVVAVFACVVASGAAIAQTSVGVSIGINQPGVYGRINIGNFPQPVLVSPQPVVIVAAPVAVQRQPIYLYVPPGHQKHWAKHCYRYNACGQPVYFVQEQWVRERYQQEHPQWRGERHGHRGHFQDGERRGGNENH
jgi:predicted DNA-binding transcriptional regulator AlpA